MLSLLIYVTEVIVALAVVVVTAAALYIYRVNDKYKHLPGPKQTSFWFGCLAEIRDLRKNKGFMFVQILHEWSQRYGNTFQVRTLPKPFIFTADPTAVKELLATGGHPKDPGAYHNLSFIYGERTFGKGIVTETDDQVWALARAIMDPAFNRKFLRSIMKTFNKAADDLMEKLRKDADGKTVMRLDHELHLITHDIIGKVAFDKDLDALNDNQNPFPHAITMVLDGFSASVKNFSKFKFWEQREFKQEVRDSARLLRTTALRWLQERRESIRNGESVPEDILTLIVRGQEADVNAMSVEVAVDNIITLFLAGQETTANSLSFALMELARRPDLKEKLCQEIDDVFDQRAEMEFEEISRLEYANMVVKETLRLYPPAPLTFRRLKEDTRIGGYNVPKGTTVLLSPYVSGRLPEFHNDALDFKPERFHPEAEDRPSTYTYFPFSLGPRNCIGQNFAQLEAKVILAKFFQKFDLELDPSQEFEVVEATTLRPKGGVRCTLTLRQDVV